MNKDLQLIAPQSKHVAQLASLLAETFPNAGARATDYRKYYLSNSAYSLQASRIAIVNSTIVAHCGVFLFRVRMGKSRLKIGGVGGVFTAPAWRGQGISRLLTEDVSIALQRNRCSLSLLSAIENFYDQFGYVPAWPDFDVTISTSELASLVLPKPRKAFKPLCQEFLTTLYNRESRNHFLTAVRPTYTKKIKTDSGAEGCSWKGGYVIGRAENETWHVQEILGDTEPSFAVAGVMARQRDCTAVVFRGLSANHPLTCDLRRYDARFSTHFRKSGGAMVRLLDLSLFLKAMRNELTARMVASQLKWNGILDLVSGEQRAALRINKNEVNVAQPENGSHSIKGNENLVQLLIGSFAVGELVARNLVTVTGDGLTLAQALFPVCSPKLARADFF